MISLERSPRYTNHNIPLDPEHYYRGLIVESYEDLWQTDENGVQTMQGRGKGGTDSLSFQKSFPNDLYVNGIVKADTIIEGDDSLPIERHEKSSGYTCVSQLERDKVEAGEIRLRVWRRRTLAFGAIKSDTWEIIHDSFEQSKI